MELKLQLRNLGVFSSQSSDPISDNLASAINKIFSMPLQKDKLITGPNFCLPSSHTLT